MGITAISGPHLVYGFTDTSSGAVTEYNEERGPSLFDLGQGTLDPRAQYNYSPGAPVGTQLKGFFDQQGIVDYTPFTAGASAIAISSVNAPVSGSALTLAPVSSNGTFQTTIIAPETGKAVSVVAIDSTAATLNFGSAGTIAIWNPAAGTGRSISVILSCANTNSEVYIVRGRDMYGFKLTENIIGSTTSSGTGTGKKAFKYVQSVTCSTTVTVTSTGVSLGFADVYGLPLKAAYPHGISVWVSSIGPTVANNITLATSFNFTVASTVVTQTATTPDIRGTYTSSIASNFTTVTASAAVRLTLYQQLSPVAAAAVTFTDTSAMFGATQFSDF